MKLQLEDMLVSFSITLILLSNFSRVKFRLCFCGMKDTWVL